MIQAEDFISFEFYKTNEDITNYVSAIDSFLSANRQLLQPVDLQNHKLNTAYMWNNYIADKLEAYEKKHLIDKLCAYTFFMTRQDESIEESYKKFISFLNSGLTVLKYRDRYLYSSEYDTCFKTGKSVRFVITSPFKPALFEFKGGELGPLSPAADSEIQHIVIDCPSGELIAADWIRIDQLSEIYKTLPYKEEFSVNHEAGSILSTIRTNETMGLLDISLGNMAVNIYQKNNQLIIGDDYNYDEENGESYAKHKGFKKVGDVCTDRWSFTCMDRLKLEQLLSLYVPDAKELIAAYIEENKPTILKVEPGKYNVYFAGNYNDFNQKFKSESFPLTPKFNYYAIISKEQLHPMPINKVAQSPEI